MKYPKEVKEAVNYIIDKTVLSTDLAPKMIAAELSSNGYVVPSLKTVAEKKLKECLRSNSELCARLNALVTKITLIEYRWSQMDTQVDHLTNRVNHLEQYGRLYNLIIDNVKYVPKCKGFRFSAWVVRLLNRLLGRYLYRHILLSDIDKSHPLYKKVNGRFVLIVRFTCRDARDDVFYKRHFLSKSREGSDIVIRENLTKSNNQVMKAAEQKFGKSHVATDQGKIIVTINKKKFKVRNELDINKLHASSTIASVSHDTVSTPARDHIPIVHNEIMTSEDDIPSQEDIFVSKTLPSLNELIEQKARSSGLNCNNVLERLIERRNTSQTV